MSTIAFTSSPSGYDTCAIQLTNADGSAARVLVEPNTPLGSSGTTALKFGGASLIELLAASNDTADALITLWKGRILSTAAAAGATGAVTTTTSSIVRAVGSWVTDGWKPGRLAMIFAPPGVAMQANEGVLCFVSGVSANTLTLTGTPLSALTVTDGSRICQMSPLFTTTVAAGSGTNGSSKATRLLNGVGDGAGAVRDRKLGQLDLLAVSAAASITAAKYVSIDGQVALY